MFDLRHATLCLLITYHWHGSWAAVSTWPSGRAGIVAEVNGSPTDAPVNIPVVKRSSNQADLANELGFLPRSSSTIVVVGGGDSQEQNRSVEFNVGRVFAPNHHEYPEYPDRRMEVYNEPLIHTRETLGMMIGPILNRDADSRDAKRPENMRTKEARDVVGKFGTEIKSSFPGKDVTNLAKLIGPRNPWNVIASSRLLPINFHYDETLVERRSKGHQVTGIDDSMADDVGGLTSTMEKSELPNFQEGIVRLMNSKVPKNGLIGIRRNGDSGLKSGAKRYIFLVERIDFDDSPRPRKRRKTNEETVNDDLTMSPRSGTSLPASKSNVSKFQRRSEQFATNSGITSSVNKLLDNARLHQQSRNTKPRTIIQHLRSVKARRETRSYDNGVQSSSTGTRINPDEYADSKRRFSERLAPIDRKDRRQSAYVPNFGRPVHGRHEPFRFIPSFNYPGRVSKSLPNRDNEVINQNIPDMPLFDVGLIENFTKSLGGVFDGRLKQQFDLPNIRKISPKRIFVAPPRLIYDTKILPAPFPFPSFIDQSDNKANEYRGNGDAVDDREKIVNSGLTINGVFDQKGMEANFDGRPGKDMSVIPVSENSEDGVTGLGNFVTPLPPYTDQVSLRVNQPVQPVVSTYPDDVYRVSGVVKMGKPGDSPEYETLQRDVDYPGANHGSTSTLSSPSSPSSGEASTGAKDHPDDVGSSYDNYSSVTYANEDESGSGNVDHSTVIEAINDEYANHQTTRYGDVTSFESDESTRTSHIEPDNTSDENYHRGDNKWREEQGNNRTRYVANYSFGYRVNDDETENEFGHREMRKEGITEGRYHVKLPDGRIQKVKYHVDEDGYHAEVSYHPISGVSA